MYKYSQVKDADIVIQQDIDKIIEAVKDKKLTAMYLFGSYGKGEGGFINNKAVNDYDILLIGGDKETEEEINKVNVTTKIELHKLDDVSNIQPTQQMFETIYGSKLLVGEDVLKDITMEDYDIPFSDAITSLDKRVLSMLIGKYEMMKDEPDYNKVVNQIGKMIIAIGDAMLIKRGQFNPSYRTRMLMLLEDDIYQLYSIAVSHKLFGLPELNPDEVWTLWNNVREYYRQYMISNQIKTDLSEILINYDDRIERDTLKGLLEALGVKSWL